MAKEITVKTEDDCPFMSYYDGARCLFPRTDEESDADGWCALGSQPSAKCPILEGLTIKFDLSDRMKRFIGEDDEDSGS